MLVGEWFLCFIIDVICFCIFIMVNCLVNCLVNYCVVREVFVCEVFGFGYDGYVNRKDGYFFNVSY